MQYPIPALTRRDFFIPASGFLGRNSYTSRSIVPWHRPSKEKSLRPVVPINPLAIWLTIFGAVVLIACALVSISAWRKISTGKRQFWPIVTALIGTGFICYGSAWWNYDAHRKPTTAEAQSWLREADALLKQKNADLDAAVKHAHEVNQQVLREEAGRLRKK